MDLKQNHKTEKVNLFGSKKKVNRQNKKWRKSKVLMQCF